MIRKWKIRWRGLDGYAGRRHIGYYPSGDPDLDLRTLAHEAAHTISGEEHTLRFWVAYDLMLEALGIEQENEFSPWRKEPDYWEKRNTISLSDVRKWASLIEGMPR